jgi:branched-chain amino acid transport system ATP-binding protein
MDDIFTLFREMNRMGLTLFIVEQEVLLSLSISSRGYLLRNGRVIKEGLASALMESGEIKVLCLGEETDRSSSSPLLSGED